jgi:hypothetical protein
MNMSFLDGGGTIGNIIWIILLIVMVFFGPQLMFYQIFWKLNQAASVFEGLTVGAKRIVIRKLSKNPTKELRDSVNHFLEFFIIEPVSLDPYGIVKKIDHIHLLSDKRFEYFVKNVAPQMNSEEQANLVMGISGAMSLNQIAKIVRHFVEIIRKTKNLQLALMLQMQLSLIEKISHALLKGTEALTNGWPIGDSIGPFVAANLIGTSKTREIEEDVLLSSKKIRGRDVLIIKAKGPGGRLGQLGRAVEGIIKRQKIAKIITIDAAAKLEGEKTGSIAEGIGVAIGGLGVDRAYIEDITTKKSIPLDSVVVKMAQEEAILPMKNEILHSTPRVIKLLEEDIERTKEKGKIIIVGVGNTSGVGNDKQAAEEAEKQVKRNVEMMIQRERGEKKEYRFFLEK